MSVYSHLQKEGGASVMVWGYISASWVRDPIKIDGMMNMEKYRQILIHHAIPSGLATASYFSMTTIPTQRHCQCSKISHGLASPDLNTIEAAWDHLDQEQNKRATSKDDPNSVFCLICCIPFMFACFIKALQLYPIFPYKV